MKIITNTFLFLTLTTHLFAAEFITIGTAGVTGTYYPTGGAICRQVNKMKKITKIRCSVESTGGSVYNIQAINEGELDFGIAQSDTVYQAYRGTDQFSNQAIKKLKSVMAIYPELLALVTRKEANIKTIMDVKGKRINLGNKGSGNEATAMVLLNAVGIKKSDLSFAGTLKAAKMPDALRDDKIDGYFYMIGHPNANIKDATNSIDTRIVPLEGEIINKLIKNFPYYAKAQIPRGLYKGMTKAVNTFGVKAVLVTSDDVSNTAVYTVVKAILEDFDSFKKLHPAYNNITKESLLDGLSAPLHEGAKRYYKEAGLL